MHVPPYHKKRTWQLFLLGMLAGGIIVYTIIMFMYGKMYDELQLENIELQTKFNDIKTQNEALQEDKEKLEEHSNYMIRSIHITFIPNKQLNIDRLKTLQFEDMIKQELRYIIGKGVKTVAENDELLIALLENKTFTVDKTTYQFLIKKLTITDDVKLTLDIRMVD